jgi:hypothetical protein
MIELKKIQTDNLRFSCKSSDDEELTISNSNVSSSKEGGKR